MQTIKEKLYNHFNVEENPARQMDDETCRRLHHVIFEHGCVNDIVEDNSQFYFLLGVHYDNLIPKNDELALKYYSIASDLGNKNAMFNLGCYYDNVDNIDLAHKYYLMAIELGDCCAMNNLGCCYDDIGNYECGDHAVDTMNNLLNLFKKHPQLFLDDYIRAFENF